jgi:methylamine dehydrogenase light chain
LSDVDNLVETITRAIASRTSRRSLFAWLGGAIAGAAAVPALPVERAAAADAAGPVHNPQDPGDPTACSYWRYCALDGALCSCCGGRVNACPPGTEMSPITWIGTCRNPADSRNYIISYNDCCGKPVCGHCDCTSSLGARPLARPQANNEVLWCLGMTAQSYTCTTASIIGVATGQPR